jgi:hypothetical protein
LPIATFEAQPISFLITHKFHHWFAAIILLENVGIITPVVWDPVFPVPPTLEFRLCHLMQPFIQMVFQLCQETACLIPFFIIDGRWDLWNWLLCDHSHCQIPQILAHVILDTTVTLAPVDRLPISKLIVVHGHPQTMHSTLI